MVRGNKALREVPQVSLKELWLAEFYLLKPEESPFQKANCLSDFFYHIETDSAHCSTRTWQHEASWL
ncbi:MAG: hypothetical protein ACXAB4_08775, partial [Candidatus Hodarchaeales archaeon]